jgi:DNA-directed RNA polymerase subunit H (RpoH/RPB5)
MATSVTAPAPAPAPAPVASIPSTLDPAVADILLRSRNTILDILEDRGYDVSKYRYIAPDQILILAEGHPRALDIIVPKKADGPAPCERAVVVYQIQDRLRLKLPTFTRDLYEIAPDAMGSNAVKRTDDVIVILNEPYHDAFDKAALGLWQTQRARMVFFHIKQVVVHPGRHVLVPPHRKLSAEEAAAVIERFHVTAKTQLPLLKHHDIQARVLGLVPGDMVEVLRPSPTAGVLPVYRICSA